MKEHLPSIFCCRDPKAFLEELNSIAEKKHN